MIVYFPATVLLETVLLHLILRLQQRTFLQFL